MHTDKSLENILQGIDDSTYGAIHRQRFIESYKFINEYLLNSHVGRNVKILDLGSYGTFADLVKSIHPEIYIQKSEYFDLRYKFPIEDNAYDMVCFMEVLEHIKDQDSTDPDAIAEYSQNGIKNVMSEINRILKPGGYLFLTTPNINSWTAIHRSLNFYSPTFYIPHVKEFSIQEIHALHKEFGFKITKLQTPENCHGLQSVQMQRPRLTKLIQACIEAGYSPDLRGDCIFSLAIKQ